MYSLFHAAVSTVYPKAPKADKETLCEWTSLNENHRNQWMAESDPATIKQGYRQVARKPSGPAPNAGVHLRATDPDFVDGIEARIIEEELAKFDHKPAFLTAEIVADNCGLKVHDLTASYMFVPK